MTQENKETETEFDVRQIRPTIQFVPEKQDTTEARLEDIREEMTFTKAKNTIRRTGWYFTESYTPCGEGFQETAHQSIKNMFGV